jgi:ElaB/YqjD/DUF883 family membrane-anchored ribosome-binding protein
MAGAAAVSEEEPEVIRESHEVTRSSLTEKVEALEHGFEEMLLGANAAVTETVEAVRDMVQTSAHAVQEAVGDTTRAVGRGLDVSAHVRRHPRLMVGGALLLGVLVGTLAGRGRR